MTAIAISRVADVVIKALNPSQILVKSLAANAKLTSDLRFAHPSGDPLANFCDFCLR
jgi:hypothetical protein